MLHFQIDPHTGIPIYRQLMDQVRHYMVSGLLGVGDRLPSIRVLARRLAVNPTTIVKAYNELEHAGVVERRHGRGVFIARAEKQLSKKQRKEAFRPEAARLASEAIQLNISRDEATALFLQEYQRIEEQSCAQ